MNEKGEGRFFGNSVKKWPKNSFTDPAILHFEHIYKRGNVKKSKKKSEKRKEIFEGEYTSTEAWLRLQASGNVERLQYPR